MVLGDGDGSFILHDDHDDACGSGVTTDCATHPWVPLEAYTSPSNRSSSSPAWSMALSGLIDGLRLTYLPLTSPSSPSSTLREGERETYLSPSDDNGERDRLLPLLEPRDDAGVREGVRDSLRARLVNRVSPCSYSSSSSSSPASPTRTSPS